MEAYFSDGLTNIIVVLEDGEVEEYSPDEFVAIFGEDALPLTPAEVDYKKKLDSYYNAGEWMCKKAGEYAHAAKLRENCEEGVYPTQQVKYRYYGVDSFLDREIETRREDFLESIEQFDVCSQAVGFKPMSDADYSTLFKLLYQGSFRSRFLDQVRRHHKNKQLVSARDISIHVHKLIKESKKSSK